MEEIKLEQKPEPDFHYGNLFIDHLKKNDMYGGCFVYAEYQQLKNCRRKDNFSDFIRKTDYRELIVKESVHDTFVDFCIIHHVLKFGYKDFRQRVTNESHVMDIIPELSILLILITLPLRRLSIHEPKIQIRLARILYYKNKKQAGEFLFKSDCIRKDKVQNQVDRF